jgi:Protein of unknown function (DUF3105)
MAQRKSPNPPAKKSGSGSRPPANQKGASTSQKGAPTKSAASQKGVPGRPPARKPGKSIVNQKQTPWGLIITTIVLVLFAGAIVTYAVTKSSSSDSASGKLCTGTGNTCYVQPELAAAKKITGVEYHKEPNHTHVTGTVKYDRSPPIGGNHNPIWADCTGTVYKTQIANENAVHMLEHGAVWITYNPKTATAADIKTLSALVDGVDRMALSPYAGLKTPISLQAWDYQLFVKTASDPRVEKFIDALRYNPNTTPEAASCSDPSFVASKSTPGHPFNG